jgi:PAS domain S-box-containing protein
MRRTGCSRIGRFAIFSYESRLNWIYCEESRTAFPGRKGLMHSDFSIRLSDSARLKAVAETSLAEGSVPPEIERLVRLAALTLKAPAAAFLLMDEKGFLPRGTFGLPDSLSARSSWPLEWSYLLDAAFTGPMSVTLAASQAGAAELGFPAGSRPFFLGAPVESADGRLLGVLAVWDAKAGKKNRDDSEVIQGLAATLGDLLAARAGARIDVGSQSDHALAEEALAASRLEIDTILKTVNTAVFAFDRLGNAIYANDAAAVMAGCRDAEEILRMDRAEILSRFDTLDPDLKPYPLDQGPTLRAMRGETVGGALIGYRLRATGALRWVVVRATPVFDARGEVRLVISVYQDVTDIKNAERELARSRDELAVMLQSIESGCTAQSPDGTLVYANDAAARILGFPDADSLMGIEPRRIMERYDVLDEDRRPMPLADFPGRRALQGEPVAGTVMCYRVKATGEERWSLVNATPLLDENGRVRLILNIFNDITALKKAQAEIQKSRNQLEIVLAGVDDAIYVSEIRGDRRLIYANHAAARLLEYPSVEALMAEGGAGLAARIRLADEAGETLLRENSPLVAAGGQPFPPTVLRLRMLPEGRERVVMVKSTPILASDGQVDLVVNIAQDITESRRAQEAISKHLRYLEGMNQVSDAIERTVDLEGVLPAALARLLDVFACDRVWLVHLSDTDVTGFRIPFSAERPGPGSGTRAGDSPIGHAALPGAEILAMEAGFDAIARACKATEEPLVFGRERPLPNPEYWKRALGVGSAKAISVRPQVGRPWILCLLRSQGAPPWGAEDFAMFKDISSRIATALGAMLLNRDLRRSEEKYRTLFERSMDGIYRCSPDGTILDANPALVAMLGFTDRAQLVGTVQKRLLPAGLDAAGFSEGGETFSVELERKEGPMWVEVNAQPIRRIGGTVAHFEGIVRNISDRKRAEEALKASEEKLRQSQKMEAVGRLAGGVAHDFNNLLTAINGFSDLLLMSVAKDDTRRVHLEEIRKAGARAAGLTSQLLAFSRKQVLAPRLVDLNTVVSGMETMLRRLIGENIVFRTQLEPHLPKVLADPSQMEQIILNLVLNARDAMPNGGELTVITGNRRLKEEQRATGFVDVTPGDYALLSVIDTGSGMDQETKSRLFEPFFTTKSKDKGTGLGLSTVYGAVKQANGTITVESEMDKGSVFSIFLPVATKEDKPEKIRMRERALRSVGGTETILLVEDEDAVRRLVRDVLEVGGYKVFEAPGGEQALEILEKQAKDVRIHLLLTDVVMGGMSGRELAERVKAVRPGTKVLFMSGYTEDAIIRHGVFTAQASFIGKPFTPAALSAKVREVLDAAKDAAKDVEKGSAREAGSRTGSAPG